jgi:hypothetical protein
MPRKQTPAQIAKTEAKRQKALSERRIFLAWLDREGLHFLPEAEFVFDQENDREWRFDYAWPRWKVALEIQGGTFVNGRHSRGPALRREYEKHNAAVVQGWHVLYALSGEVMTPAMIDTLKRMVP